MTRADSRPAGRFLVGSRDRNAPPPDRSLSQAGTIAVEAELPRPFRSGTDPLLPTGGPDAHR